MIMDCERCIDDLTAYLDGELTPRRSAEIQSHLSECGTCSHEMQALTSSAGFIESHIKEIPLKPEIWNNVKARLSTEEIRQHAGFSSFWLWNWPKVTATAFAAVSVMAFGFWGYLHYEESQENLRHYMNEYVTVRDAQLQKLGMSTAFASASPQTTGILHLEETDNPFAEPLTDSYHNPFRSEGE
jgi:hypothetical protein